MMATNVPSSLKSADIGRFALRAGQLEKVKPAIAYWCNYWIVQQIVMKSLHNSDDESKLYTSRLMDKLEQMKVEFAQDDAITDDVAGKALIEQFGLDVFQKGENAMRANKASRQTADTLLASSTFLELLGIWPPIDPEIIAKTKFAKYHALRIAKALKAGEDPNLTNPSTEDIPAPETAPTLDPDDPEVQALGGLPGQTLPSETLPRQPSVEEVPDEQDRLQPALARTSTLDQSLHPSRAPSVPRPDTTPNIPNDTTAENFYQSAGNGEVSPLGPEPTDRKLSEGGGYFPRMPPPNQHADEPVLPQQPQNPPVQQHPGFTDPLSKQPLVSPDEAPQQRPSQAPVSSPSAGQSYLPGMTPRFLPTASQAPYSHPHPNPSPYSNYSSQPAAYTSPSTYQTPQPVVPQENFVPDEEAITKAQKHARWAISALNFEDVKTAIIELEGALKTLRGS